MSKSEFKQRLLEQFAKVGKALSSPSRLEILEFLAQSEKSVENLTALTGLSFANTSQHLQQLRHAGMVVARKDGQRVFYSLADESAIDLLNKLRDIAEKNLAEVDQLINSYLKVKDSLEPVEADDLLQRIKDGLVIVLDVRPPDEFAAGHVPGSINVPVKELEKQIKKLDHKKEIVAYCRGPYCVLSYDTVAILRNKGFKARRLKDGMPEWKRAGLPVEK
ncbi:MAG: metalloregulator ArsR/SmtB family transcription factor [Nitrospinae bacterium]|nr:metalloregulator ArsR/SmtB family transcription factor [Nitrospinota bacterium]MBF0633264.1 metalloregulator ArsR/SmtB family transcription factor [Nitrospinota bacterium]